MTAFVRWKGRAALGVVGVLAGLCAPAVCYASISLGEVDPASASFSCFGGGVDIQALTSSAPGYTVPAGGGVITSWSTRALVGQQQSAALEVLKIVDATHYTVVGASALSPLVEDAGPDGGNTFATQIPVAGGETLGYYFPNHVSQECYYPSANAGDVEAAKDGDFPEPGVGASITTSSVASRRINIQATLEPDADHDGYGDETQDGCPTKAAVHTSCQAAAPAAPVVSSNANPVDRTKPTLGGLSFLPTSFAAAKSGASTARKHKPKVGTKVSFSLSELSSVKFTVQRKTKGRKVGRKCKTATHANRKKKSCSLYKSVRGSFTLAGKAGKNTFTFRGRIGGKALRRGSYRLNGTATDTAKNVSVPKQKGFKIVR